MPPRTFQHPLHRHPVVGPLLTLAEPSTKRHLDPALALELRIARHLAVRRFERYARARGLAGAQSELRLDSARLPAELRDVPEDLLGLYRPSRFDRIEGPEALARAVRLGREGPTGVAGLKSTAARRLARTGVWPGVTPRFIGRLDARVGPEAYAPSPALAVALVERGRIADAHAVVRRLQGGLRRAARRAVIEARVRRGAPVDALAGAPTDEVWRAVAAWRVRDGDDAGAEQACLRIQDARRRHLCETQMAWHHLLETRDEAAAHRWLRRAVACARPSALLRAPEDGEVSGAWLLAFAEHRRRRHELRDAWDLLLRAARRPRRGTFDWHAGRPDAEITTTAVAIALEAGGPVGPWPWAGAHRVRDLDDLDRARSLVARVGRGLATAPKVQPWLQPHRLAARIGQAAEVLRVEALDWSHPGPARAAPEAEAFVRGILADIDFASTLPRDPSDPVRACFDDGLARSEAGRRHRKALVRAAKQALARARTSTASCAAAEVRLSTLAEVGGGRAAQVLQSHLRASGPAHPTHEAAVGALVEVSAGEMPKHMMQSALQFGNRPRDDGLRRRLEREGHLPPGFAKAAQRLLKRALTVRGQAPDAWWADLCAAHWDANQSAPPPLLLDAIRALAPAQLGRDARALVHERLSAARALGELSSDRWLERLTGDRAELLTALSNQALYSPWDCPERWHRVLSALRHEDTGRPSAAVVQRWANGLGAPAEVTDRLLAGRSPTEALEQPTELRGQGLRLRGLHKVQDAFTFLRFADCVSCCFNSRCRGYVEVDAERYIRKLWRDPLSFCLRLETAAPPNRGRGFVFGGFGFAEDGAPVLLLNGLYLTRPSRDLRLELLEHIEIHLAAPLEISQVGIGNVHGGHGALPAAYRRRERSVLRVRALQDSRGRLDREVYDDISTTVNRRVPLDLAWRNLNYTSASSVGSRTVKPTRAPPPARFSA